MGGGYTWRPHIGSRLPPRKCGLPIHLWPPQVQVQVRRQAQAAQPRRSQPGGAANGRPLMPPGACPDAGSGQWPGRGAT
eukprot:scaffold15416_cov106-Isochrysis_galbana.AAC.2